MKRILSITLIGLCAGVLVMYTKPAFDRSNELKADLVQFEETRRQAEDLKVKWQEVLDNYTLLSEDDIGRLVKMVPDNIDNIKLILEINELTSLFGVKLKNIDVEDPEIEKKNGPVNPLYASVGIKFSISGNYQNFIAFMGRIERSLRIIDIKQFSFKSSKEEKNPENYDFELIISTYWLRK